eukprot:TRINITY_DN14817_c0_g2_i1.p1 TRINITY_DN14817_c0_g2~~TRINITY_DN14817_c0_g2_i1.p1  ORF type:complete len:335 (+),score=18.23 TRINITY_DN14817_c0_g2_i1:62-1066(+)
MLAGLGGGLSVGDGFPGLGLVALAQLPGGGIAPVIVNPQVALQQLQAQQPAQLVYTDQTDPYERSQRRERERERTGRDRVRDRSRDRDGNRWNRNRSSRESDAQGRLRRGTSPAKSRPQYPRDSRDEYTALVRERVRAVLDTSALGKPELGFAEGGPAVHDLLSKLFAAMLVDNAEYMKVEEDLGNYIREQCFGEFYQLIKAEADMAKAELKGLDPSKAAPRGAATVRPRWRPGDHRGKGWGWGKGGKGVPRHWDPNEEYRLSPLNGRAYSKAMFMQHFGGLREWDAAQPAPAGYGHVSSVTTPTPPQHKGGQGAAPAAAPSPAAAVADEWGAD